MNSKLSPELSEIISKVKAKRPKTVINHIIKYGYITTEDLKNIYGYDHPPRAIRDVREQGIPLITFKVKSSTTGRQIGAYKFDDLGNIQSGKIGGRSAFSKAFKKELVTKFKSRSTLTGEELDPRYLQIDHRIPYEIAGNEANITDIEEFMLLDASSQRAKSWSCEHCQNFLEFRDPSICKTCFWAYPEKYEHIAMINERRIYLVWQGDETKSYELLEKVADRYKMSIMEYIKFIISKFLSDT